MATTSVWASLANAPPPPSSSEGPTLCEIQALLVTLQANLDVTKGNGATQLSTQARLATADVLKSLPDVTLPQQRATNTPEGQQGIYSTPGRSAYPSGSRRSLPRSTSMSAAGKAKNAFLSPTVEFPISESSTASLPILKRAFSKWYQEGWLSALQDVVDSNSADQKNSVSYSQKFLAAAANILLSLHSFTRGLHGSLYPSLNISGEEVTELYTSTRNWSNAPVRCIAWHPHTCKIAVAMADDSIQVNMGSVCKVSEEVAPLLKYKQQRGVSCMQWRPFLASELAVGCNSGLLIWNVDPCSVVARPSAGCVSLLQSPGHAPVTSISWHSKGSLLLSCSANDSTLILWNTASETKVPLRRMGAGFHMVLWSPHPGLILSCTTSTSFRIWYPNKLWASERWNVMGGHVNSACWSPDGTTLLFTTNTECQIFCLKFMPTAGSSQVGVGSEHDRDYLNETSLQSSGAAVPVMDLSTVSFNCEDGEQISSGGCVQSMRWDPTGERLVVSFQANTVADNSEEKETEDSGLLCVFSTKISPSNVVILPLGFIRGDADETPNAFEFAQHFKDGSLLTIAWSSGRIQHLPMFFTTTPTAPMESGIPYHRQMQQNVNENSFPSYLSTSHLLNNSLNAVTDFEPQLFSSPSV